MQGTGFLYGLSVCGLKCKVVYAKSFGFDLDLTLKFHQN
jgi:hypothetical protein